MTPRVKDLAPGGDGRSTRWSEHRETRRTELVAAAVAAIDEHGPAASISQIAASAGVSKPVLYRYFSDKEDLYRAVGHWGADEVTRALLPALVQPGPMRDRVYGACAAYFTLIAEHPQVFLLLIEHRSTDDPLADGKEQIATSLAKLIGDTLRHLGVDAAGAEPWAHGVVGMGLSVGEWWLRRDIMSREAASDYLAAFIWNAFSGFVADHGVGLDGAGQLRLVEVEAVAPRPARRAGRKDA
ncbi:AcrR family transcriptional regulator [Marmoricola sp. URHA0025 HA25]